MTTTTTFSSIEIRYGRANLGPDTSITQAESYEQSVADAVAEEYPGAKVQVIGERSNRDTTVRLRGGDDLTYDVASERIVEIANRVWESWCRSHEEG